MFFRSYPQTARRCFGFGAASLTTLTALTACIGTATGTEEDKPASVDTTDSGGAGPGGAGSGATGSGATDPGATDPGSAAPTCDDGVQNGSEEGVDCGGPDCGGCATGSIDCSAVCANTAPNGCFDSAKCNAKCVADSPGWSPAVADAFAKCAANDPLCFQKPEDCMLKALYPDPIAQEVTLSASGFDAHEGHTVHAAFVKHSGELIAAPPQKVTGGAFKFTWSVVMPVYMNGYPAYYVDVDENGSCSADVDLPALEITERSQGFDLPSWSATITGPGSKIESVCDHF
jgi:hypothetical protein